MIKISVTKYTIWLKNYLNLSYDKINSPTQSRGDLTTLARAINNLKLILKFKKKYKKIHSLITDITGLLFSTLTIHFNLSLFFKFIIPAISDGIVVLKDFERGFCLMILDSTSNNFMTSFLSFLVNIFVMEVYIFYP